MPVELRKRKAPAPPPAPARPSKKKAPSTAAASETKPAPAKKDASGSNGAKAPAKVAAGDVIQLEGFGGEVETNDGEKTSLKKLVDESKSGIVLFTYPKASTPGCGSPEGYLLRLARGNR
jgi:peroxiredoxin Q/BCP